MGEFSWASFLEMGGYASYIWPVYGLAAVMMIGLIIHAIARYRANEKELKILEELKDK